MAKFYVFGREGAEQAKEVLKRVSHTPRGKVQPHRPVRGPQPIFASCQIINTNTTNGYYPANVVVWDPDAQTWGQPNNTASAVWLYFPDPPGSLANSDVFPICKGIGTKPEDGVPIFGHAGAEGISEGGGGTITVEEQDGSPSYSSINTVQINQADGFVLTNPTNGKALISIDDASVSGPGIVSTGAQEFNGSKTFDDGVIAESGIYFTNVNGFGQSYGISIAGQSGATPGGTCYIFNNASASQDGRLNLRANNTGGSNSLDLIVDYTNGRAYIDAVGGGSQPTYSIDDSGTIYDGVHDTFATNDGRTATVRGGIITDIS